MIFSTSETGSIDFSEVLETSSETLRLNLSGSSGTVPLSSGSIGVKISANSSSQFSFGEAFYDLELISGSTYPVVTRILEGKVQLSKEVTTGTY